MNFHAPHIDYGALSPVLALTVGLCVVLLSGVFKPLKRSCARADPGDAWQPRRGC